MWNQGFSHMGLTCQDPIQIENFYTAYFGFKRARVYAPGPDQVVVLKGPGISLELFKAAEKSPAPPAKEAGPMYPGWRHLCFSVSDLNQALREIGSAAKITQGPVDMGGFISGMKVCWIADPEGNIIELNQGYKDEF
jgi:glyoxylase I family protein